MKDDSYRITLAPKLIENASPGTVLILETTKKETGMTPNMYSNMANAPALLSTYSHGYKMFRSESGFTPSSKR